MNIAEVNCLISICPGYRLVEGIPAVGSRECLGHSASRYMRSYDNPTSVSQFIVPAVKDADNMEYQLSHESGLFRTFAETDSTLDSIMLFTQRFGLLGMLPIHILNDKNAHIGNTLSCPAASSLEFTYGFPVEIFIAESNRMKASIDLWDLYRTWNFQELDQRLNYKIANGKPISFLFSYPPQGDKERVVGRRQGVNYVFPNSDLVLDMTDPTYLFKAARALVFQEINYCLSKTSVVDIGESHVKKGFPIRFSAKALLDGLWYQFAFSVAGNYDYRSCDECGMWYQIVPEIARTNRKYCSNACRSRAYRKRQAEAVMLHKQGYPIEEIATRLETDVKTAKRWISIGK